MYRKKEPDLSELVFFFQESLFQFHTHPMPDSRPVRILTKDEHLQSLQLFAQITSKTLIAFQKLFVNVIISPQSTTRRFHPFWLALKNSYEIIFLPLYI